jgi:alcohol oxidase
VPEVQKAVFDEWNIKGTGPLATNGIDAGVKVRPTEEELKEMESWPTPHFKSVWLFQEQARQAGHALLSYCRMVW